MTSLRQNVPCTRADRVPEMNESRLTCVYSESQPAIRYHQLKYSANAPCSSSVPMKQYFTIQRSGVREKRTKRFTEFLLTAGRCPSEGIFFCKGAFPVTAPREELPSSFYPLPPLQSVPGAKEHKWSDCSDLATYDREPIGMSPQAPTEALCLALASDEPRQYG